MKALLLAAGLGSRLQPLTNDKPKALVDVDGKTMLEHALLKLENSGIEDIVVNVHHFAEQVISFLQNYKSENLSISISDERGKLLNTGGAVKKAADLLDGEEPFVIYNVDIWSDVDLVKMINEHKKAKSLATLAVRDRTSSRYLIFDEKDRLCGWQKVSTMETIYVNDCKKKQSKLAFSGIQVVSPELFEYFPGDQRFSLVDLYLNAAPTKRIKAYRHDSDHWFDLGTTEKIENALPVIKDSYGK